MFSKPYLQFKKSHVGSPLGPRGEAEAGERSEATNGGRSGAPRRFSAKKSEILSQIHATQPKITSQYV